MSNVNGTGITYQPGIGAMTTGGNPFVNTTASVVELLYAQELSNPVSIVTDVGRGAGTPGNLPVDPLNDPIWNNAAVIARGTFGALRPAFTSNSNTPPNFTDGNVLATKTPPFASLAAATVTTIVRDNLANVLGDYNHNGSVDAADYVVWRKTNGQMGSGLAADGDGNMVVNEDDYVFWRIRFGMTSGAGAGSASGSATLAAVPEPTSAISVLLMLATFMLFKRRVRFYKSVVPLATPGLFLALALWTTDDAHALPRTWIGGNADWVDGGSTANWNPADEPDSNDEAIFNSANTVNLGTNNSIQALTMSGGIDLLTNDQDLTVAGLIQLIDASTNLLIGGGSLVTAEDVTINNGGQVRLTGGVLTVNEPGGTGVLTTNAGGMLSGHGTVNLDQPLMVVATLLNNNGQINAQRDPFLISGAPVAGTLTIDSAAVGARIDLDGSGENGIVNVRRNQTLDINVSLNDAFHGDVNLFHNSTLQMPAWTLAGGTIDVDNGFVAGVFPNPNIPAGVAVISGGSLVHTGGTITVADADGTLQFDAIYSQSAGSFVNNGLVAFNANSAIGSGANFTMPTNASSITVNAGVAVNVDQADFNPDGNGQITNVITINSGVLDLDLGVGADDSLTGAPM